LHPSNSPSKQNLFRSNLLDHLPSLNTPWQQRLLKSWSFSDCSTWLHIHLLQKQNWFSSYLLHSVWLSIFKARSNYSSSSFIVLKIQVIFFKLTWNWKSSSDSSHKHWQSSKHKAFLPFIPSKHTWISLSLHLPFLWILDYLKNFDDFLFPSFESKHLKFKNTCWKSSCLTPKASIVSIWVRFVHRSFKRKLIKIKFTSLFFHW
jgi:hypothetical protein